MSWHFQVAKEVDADGSAYYEMHEVYPALQGEGEPMPITAHGIKPGGESVDDLRWMLKAMLHDLDKYPVISMSDYDEGATKSATLEELRDMRAAGTLTPASKDTPEDDMPDGFWDDATTVEAKE